MSKYDDTTGTVIFSRYTDADGTVIYVDDDGDTFQRMTTNGELDRLVPHSPIVRLAK